MKKTIKADKIMAAYTRSFLGCSGEHKELLDTLAEWKENGMKEEEYFICTPYELHVCPDADSPSAFVSVRGEGWKLDQKLETVAEVFYDGYLWDFWCEESYIELKWRLNNIVWLWNRTDVEGML